MTYADVTRAARDRKLATLGAFHEDGHTIVMLGPDEPGFWQHVTAHAAFTGDNPLDAWSAEVITGLAVDLNAQPLFPFGGPPYNPFIAWALRSGEAWQSPVGLLVHSDAGLLVSYRGALRLAGLLDLPEPAAKPCDNCVEKPCITACPVNALTADGYDVPRCIAHIEVDPVCGAGCRVRLTCPVSRGFARDPAQTAFHMKAFVVE